MKKISNVRVAPNNATCTVRKFLAGTPTSQEIDMLIKGRWYNDKMVFFLEYKPTHIKKLL